ncbi:Uncharacterised protein [Mycobacteroides abscessus subsp. abscessus]|nr:Uncharacterised protein [Mycobacteroides abscessus subsp. abscessus]
MWQCFRRRRRWSNRRARRLRNCRHRLRARHAGAETRRHAAARCRPGHPIATPRRWPLAEPYGCRRCRGFTCWAGVRPRGSGRADSRHRRTHAGQLHREHQCAGPLSRYPGCQRGMGSCGHARLHVRGGAADSHVDLRRQRRCCRSPGHRSSRGGVPLRGFKGTGGTDCYGSAGRARLHAHAVTPGAR